MEYFSFVVNKFAPVLKIFILNMKKNERNFKPSFLIGKYGLNL